MPSLPPRTSPEGRCTLLNRSGERNTRATEGEAMARELSLYQAGGLSRSTNRRMRRELDRLDAQGALDAARINHQADLQAERVAAVGYVGKRAMHEVAMLSQLEVQL